MALGLCGVRVAKRPIESPPAPGVPAAGPNRTLRSHSCEKQARAGAEALEGHQPTERVTAASLASEATERRGVDLRANLRVALLCSVGVLVELVDEPHVRKLVEAVQRLRLDD